MVRARRRIRLVGGDGFLEEDHAPDEWDLACGALGALGVQSATSVPGPRPCPLGPSRGENGRLTRELEGSGSLQSLDGYPKCAVCSRRDPTSRVRSTKTGPCSSGMPGFGRGD